VEIALLHCWRWAATLGAGYDERQSEAGTR
jgi:hypothetical protein